MKALTLTQPWGALVAIGAKLLETRSWSTSYRGELAIHVAKTFPGECRELCYEEPFRSVLIEAGLMPVNPCRTSESPRSTKARNLELLNLGALMAQRGLVIATCLLTNCLPTEHFGKGAIKEPLSEQERAFGDYSPGRYAFVLEDVCSLLPKNPTDTGRCIPARGALGLWDLDEQTEAAWQAERRVEDEKLAEKKRRKDNQMTLYEERGYDTGRDRHVEGQRAKKEST